MDHIDIIALNKVIATFATKDSSERSLIGHPQVWNTGFAVIRLAELLAKEKCSVREFLSERKILTKTLGVLGMDLIGHVVACQAGMDFGMKILYHHVHPVPEVEVACNACLLSLDEVLRQADIVCVALPLPRAAETLMREQKLISSNLQTIFLAWQRLPPIEVAVAHLSARYAEHIHLDELALVAGISKFHLVRLFTTTLGITPHRYQVLLKVLHAKEMLRHGDPIGEVAFHVGFCDQSHFHRYFSQIVGITPGQYQKKTQIGNRRNFIQDIK